MIQKGAILEVKKFMRLKVRKEKSANKAIGINEIKDHLNEKKEINDVIDKISIKTRQYAKRQSTWGRGNMIEWKKINPNYLSQFLKKI
jgi:tRNA delta(2)-isopentenylpyrophosphate transferase